MEKKSSRGIPASSFLVASSPPPPLALVSSCNEERTREGEDSGGRKRRRRVGLASWATRAFLNCIPACVATSRFTHASTHAYVQRRTQTRSRLLGGGASSSTPRKYSGQYIPPLLLSLSCSAPPLTSPCLAPLLPFTASCSFFFASSRPRNCALNRANFASSSSSSSSDASEFWDAFEWKNSERDENVVLAACPPDDFAKIPSSSCRANLAKRHEKLRTCVIFLENVRSKCHISVTQLIRYTKLGQDKKKK